MQIADKLSFLIIVLLMFVLSCQKSEIQYPEPLPENEIVNDNESGMTARYTMPTSRYDHGVLGDKIEAGGLFVTYNGRQYEYELSVDRVFEDIKPRLVDLDKDQIPEIITILTSINEGASVAVFKLFQENLIVLAQSNYIGRTKRWLNIAEIDDLDEDGSIELSWVTTPHIGGVLKMAHLVNNKLVVLDSIEGVSNHKINSRNQNLSMILKSNGEKVLYVPEFGFESVIGFKWINNEIIVADTLAQSIDYSYPLIDQLYLN